MKIELNTTEAAEIVNKYFTNKGVYSDQIEITPNNELNNNNNIGELSGADWAAMANLGGPGASKLFAIKMYRTIYRGRGLAEAKRAIEGFMEEFF